MRKIREIITILSMCFSVLLYMTTFLFTVNEYAGKVGMPFVISTSAITIIIIFLAASIIAMVIGYLLSKKGKYVTVVGVIILMLNIYRMSEMITILNLVEKLNIPYV